MRSFVAVATIIITASNTVDGYMDCDTLNGYHIDTDNSVNYTYYCTDYATGTGGNTLDPPMLCPMETMVQKITGQYQSGYGMVDILIECSNGEVMRSTYNTNGGEDNPIECPDGFGQITTYEQTGYGIINWQLQCLAGNTSTSNTNYNQDFTRELACKDGDNFVGMQTMTTWGYGIVNMWAICWDAATVNKVTGEWLYMETLSGTQTFTLYHGTTKTVSMTETDTYTASITAGVSEKLTVTDVLETSETEVSASSTISATLATTYKSEWSVSTSEQWTVQYDDSYTGSSLWQWQFFIYDNYGNSLTTRSQEYALTAGQYQPPKCYPGYMTDGVSYQECYSNESTLPWYQS